MAVNDLKQVPDARKPQGFLSRLARDRTGNAMVIMGMAMIPITAMIGSGVDISRAYLAQARLQQACDAGALAIRRSMTGNVLDADDIAEGRKFFNFNFPPSSYQLTNLTFAATQVAGSNAVAITTTGTLPNKVMTLFGFASQPLSVTCNASQDFVSADIVFVLDVTGSMNDKTSDGEVKINSLRSAVLKFYEQLKPAQDALYAKGLQLRYGFVPYSSTVNVGKLLLDKNCAALRDSGTKRGTCTLTSQSSKYRTSDNTGSTGYDTFSHTNAWLKSSSYSGCIEERKTVDIGATGAKLSDAYDLDINMMPTVTDPNTQWVPWDTAPGVSSNSGKWDANKSPYGDPNSGYTACPAPAKRLQKWDNISDLSNYLNTLVPVGGTYHDVGMIWGARFISTGGVFADSPVTVGGLDNKRYLIFMTDGQMAPNPEIYGLYGVEKYDRRIGGSVDGGAIGTALNTTDLTARHQSRFDLMCNRVKSMQVSVWMVVFDDTLSNSLQNCATNKDQASSSMSKVSLEQKFQIIAKNIGTLRLTQ